MSAPLKLPAPEAAAAQVRRACPLINAYNLLLTCIQPPSAHMSCIALCNFAAPPYTIPAGIVLSTYENDPQKSRILFLCLRLPVEHWSWNDETNHWRLSEQHSRAHQRLPLFSECWRTSLPENVSVTSAKRLLLHEGILLHSRLLFLLYRSCAWPGAAGGLEREEGVLRGASLKVRQAVSGAAERSCHSPRMFPAHMHGKLTIVTRRMRVAGPRCHMFCRAVK